MGGLLITGDFERKIRFYQVTLLNGESKRYVKGSSGNGLSLHRGTWKGACFTEDFINRWRALEMKCLCLWELWDRNLKGGLLYWGCQRICKRRLWKGPSLSIQAPLGTWRGERGLVYQRL